MWAAAKPTVEAPRKVAAQLRFIFRSQLPRHRTVDRASLPPQAHRNTSAANACSAGSACQSGSVSASHVLTAMGVSPELANAALRLSLGCLSNEACVQRVADVLGTLAGKARGSFVTAN